MKLNIASQSKALYDYSNSLHLSESQINKNYLYSKEGFFPKELIT